VTTSVNGTPATLRTSSIDYSDNWCIGLAWPRDGHWLTIQTCHGEDSADDLSVDDVVRVAEGVTSGTTPSVPSDSRITAVSLPPGYVIDYWADTGLAASQGALGEIKVSLADPGTPRPIGAVPLTVDGLPAFDADDDLIVLLPDGRQLWIHTQNGGLGDCIAIYRTVTVE
jgi:hypothetical protein